MTRIGLFLSMMVLVAGCASSRSTSPGVATSDEDVLAPREYAAPRPAVWEALTKSLKVLKWRVSSEDPATGVMTAQTPMTIWTWGDTVTIVASEVESGKVRVHVTSSTAQAIDWGKNKKNIEALYEKLDAELRTSETPTESTSR